MPAARVFVRFRDFARNERVRFILAVHDGTLRVWEAIESRADLFSESIIYLEGPQGDQFFLCPDDVASDVLRDGDTLIVLEVDKHGDGEGAGGLSFSVGRKRKRGMMKITVENQKEEEEVPKKKKRKKQSQGEREEEIVLDTEPDAEDRSPVGRRNRTKDETHLLAPNSSEKKKKKHRKEEKPVVEIDQVVEDRSGAVPKKVRKKERNDYKNRLLSEPQESNEEGAVKRKSLVDSVFSTDSKGGAVPLLTPSVVPSADKKRKKDKRNIETIDLSEDDNLLDEPLANSDEVEGQESALQEPFPPNATDAGDEDVGGSTRRRRKRKRVRSRRRRSARNPRANGNEELEDRSKKESLSAKGERVNGMDESSDSSAEESEKSVAVGDRESMNVSSSEKPPRFEVEDERKTTAEVVDSSDTSCDESVEPKNESISQKLVRMAGQEWGSSSKKIVFGNSEDDDRNWKPKPQPSPQAIQPPLFKQSGPPISFIPRPVRFLPKPKKKISLGLVQFLGRADAHPETVSPRPSDQSGHSSAQEPSTTREDKNSTYLVNGHSEGESSPNETSTDTDCRSLATIHTSANRDKLLQVGTRLKFSVLVQDIDECLVPIFTTAVKVGSVVEAVEGQLLKTVVQEEGSENRYSLGELQDWQLLSEEG